jgi:hypothetical protein
MSYKNPLRPGPLYNHGFFSVDLYELEDKELHIKCCTW